MGVAADYLSGQINLGFVPDDSQVRTTLFTAHCAPDTAPDCGGYPPLRGFLPPRTNVGVTGYQDTGEATIIRYLLLVSGETSGTGKINGVPYADYGACVRAVSYLVPPGPVISHGTNLTYWGTANAPEMPEDIEISTTFDLSSLHIESSMDLTVNNFRGGWSNYLGTGRIDTTGQFAIAAFLGLNGGSGNCEFVGIGNTSFESSWTPGGNDRTQLHCNDLWQFLDVMCFAVPWVDGWNVYAVQGMLAGLAQIPRSMLAFAHLIPDDPYCPSPGLDPSANYFMPVTPGGSPATRFGNGQKIKDLMLRVSSLVGGVMYWDTGVYNSGLPRLHFEKFIIPAGPITVFQGYDGEDAATGDPLGVWEGSYGGGFSEVRNAVSVIGINALGPLWDPIVAHQVDLGSVYDDSALNYKGYFDSEVKADSMFATVPFADLAAVSTLSYLRVPDRNLRLKAWYQDHTPINIGSLVTIDYKRTGANSYPAAFFPDVDPSTLAFFVTGKKVRRSKGRPATMDISARLVPPSLNY